MESTSPEPTARRPETAHRTPRRHGRLPQEGLSSSLGPIVDLSGGGMQVRTRSTPAGRSLVVIKGPGVALSVTCRLVWTRRAGLFTTICGLAFESLDETQQRTLTALASAHRWRRTL